MNTFDDSIKNSAIEFHLLRERAENKTLFDQAVEWMRNMRFKADIAKGRTLSRNGEIARFINYDWSDEYNQNPHFVFHDFFKPHLLNKYSRFVRGVDA